MVYAQKFANLLKSQQKSVKTIGDLNLISHMPKLYDNLLVRIRLIIDHLPENAITTKEVCFLHRPIVFDTSY